MTLLQAYGWCWSGRSTLPLLFFWAQIPQVDEKVLFSFFFYVLELMKINLYVMYNSITPKRVSLYNFSLRIVSDLLELCNVLNPSVPRPDLRIIAIAEKSRLFSHCMPAELTKRVLCNVCLAQFKNGYLNSASQTKNGCKPSTTQ